MKNIIRNNAWVLMIVFFMIMLAVMYKIVDRTELVGAATIKATPDDIAEEMFWDDLENLALCTMAECGYVENTECIRATADVMINRVYDDRFPDTFFDVFSQPGQYATFKYYYSIDPTDRVYTICREQMEYFWKNGVTMHPGAFYFRTKYFHSFGKPLYQIGPHFFTGL